MLLGPLTEHEQEYVVSFFLDQAHRYLSYYRGELAGGWDQIGENIWREKKKVLVCVKVLSRIFGKDIKFQDVTNADMATAFDHNGFS